MLPRFYLPTLDPAAADAALPPEEARHLTRVLRLGVGDELRVFDGHGVECLARVAHISRDTVTVTLAGRVDPAPSPRVALTLVQSVLKGDAMDDVVRDATMRGVETIQPIVSARTTVKETVIARAGERWARIALASAKQSGRATLPRLLPPAPFGGWLTASDRAGAFVLLEPDAAVRDMMTVRRLVAEPTPSAAVVVVGPEGGWTTEERDRALAAGCRPLSLGPLTLRADAVPLAAIAALLSVWTEEEKNPRA